MKPTPPFRVRLETVADPRPPGVCAGELAEVAERLGLVVEAEVNSVLVFAVPGESNETVTARWADCLGDNIEIPGWKRKRPNSPSEGPPSDER